MPQTVPLSALYDGPLRHDPMISGLALDSRRVQPGFVFAAFRGVEADGTRFVPQAIAAGARVVVVPEDVTLTVPDDVLVMPVADPRAVLARMAARFYAPQPRVNVAITGTNGKTSVAWFLRQIWARLGHDAACIGTLGVVTDAGVQPLGMTTPDTVTLHHTLQDLAAAGVQHVALEASSHGLDQRRLDGVGLAAVAFTNLTQDHLDYHPDMAAYRDAKLRLFNSLAQPGRLAVICADGAGAADFMSAARQRGLQILTTGRQGDDLVLLDQRPHPAGQVLRVCWQGQDYDVDAPLAGGFQGDNLLVAAALVLGLGADPAATFAACATVQAPPGRMQGVSQGVYVDYAHTPDGLARVLRDLRVHTPGRLLVVFGCGGDRDAAKRPLMGRIAAEHADVVIVTDDNPRREDPDTIRAAVRAGCPDAVDIADRRAAMAHALALRQPGDVVLVAGKGHESGQIYGDTVLPFDDVAVVQQLLGDGA